MSFLPGMFYVHMECDRRHYLVAFPSRASADQFWRIVQRVDDRSRECRRHNPQYLTVPVLPNRTQTDGWDPKLCIVHPIPSDQPLPIAPPDNRPDNVNGSCFYIRSTLHPEFYWHFNPASGQVEVSRTHQTRFIIQRRRPLSIATRPNEDILIGDDDITISVAPHDSQGRSQAMRLMRDQRNMLVPGNNGGFKFKHFESGFYAIYPGDDGPLFVASRPESGERWEFVA